MSSLRNHYCFTATKVLNHLSVERPCPCVESETVRPRCTNSNRQVGLSLPEALSHKGSAKPLTGLRALDVGCGGGLLSEVRGWIGGWIKASMWWIRFTTNRHPHCCFPRDTAVCFSSFSRLSSTSGGGRVYGTNDEEGNFL